MHKTILAILFSLPLLALAQSDSLTWLSANLTRIVGKEVSLVRPDARFEEDARLMLNAYTEGADAAFQEKLEYVISLETSERKEEIIAAYGNLFFNGTFYPGQPHEIVEWAKNEFKRETKENHDRSVVVTVFDGTNYVAYIVNFPAVTERRRIASKR